MARFRLNSAHVLFCPQIGTHVHLEGDRELEDKGEERGTIVGDGTPYPVVSATLEMIPLDAEAEKMIEAEERRISRNRMSVVRADQRVAQVQTLVAQQTYDDYDDRYVPGSPGRRRPEIAPDRDEIPQDIP